MDPLLVTGWRVENVVFLSEGEDIQELSSEEFTLEAETAISTAQGGSASMGLDLIYIVKAQTPDTINSIAAIGPHRNYAVGAFLHQRITNNTIILFLKDHKETYL